MVGHDISGARDARRDHGQKQVRYHCGALDSSHPLRNLVCLAGPQQLRWALRTGLFAVFIVDGDDIHIFIKLLQITIEMPGRCLLLN